MTTDKARTRACDRCAILKTQCDLSHPCSRCSRLSLDCTEHRPLPKRGRPKLRIRPPADSTPQLLASETDGVESVSSTSHIEDPADSQPLPLHSITWPGSTSLELRSILSSISDLPVDISTAASHIDRTLASDSDFGLLEPLLKSASGIGSFELGKLTVSCLLSLSLELHWSVISGVIKTDIDRIQHILRFRMLEAIPPMTSHSWQPSSHLMFVLTAMSYMWCFTRGLASDAARWNDMSYLFAPATSCLYSYPSHESAADLDRLLTYTNIQDSIVSLMICRPSRARGFRHHQSSSNGPFPASGCNNFSLSSGSACLISDSYIGLLLPLFNLLDEFPHDRVRSDEELQVFLPQLEDYFLHFPPHLLNLKDLRAVYQVEAILLFHGIHMIACGLHLTPLAVGILKDLDVGCDMANIIFCHNISDHRLLGAFEHSFLFSAALTTLTALHVGIEQMSPITAFLVCLSSSVLIATLQQFRLSSFEMSTQGSIVPDQLSKATEAHLQALMSMRQLCRRYDLPLQPLIFDILSSCLGCARGNSEVQRIDCHELAFYRWVRGGTGALPLKDDDAAHLWPSTTGPHQLWWFGSHPPSLSVRSELSKLCLASQNVRQAGYFDLGISNIPVGITSDYREHVTGVENQSLRYIFRQARKSLVAISDCGVPIIALILPVAIQEPIVRKCLIALSERFRKTVKVRRFTRSSENHNQSTVIYQEAIQGLITSLMMVDPTVEVEQKFKALYCARILSIFSFAEADSGWSSHVHGCLSLIESMGHKLLDETRLGQFSKAAAAHTDIAAFSVGRAEASRHAWLQWRISSPRTPYDRFGEQEAGTMFTPYEITVGYPYSLVTLIATVSHAASEKAEGIESVPSSILGRCGSLETMIWNWTAPSKPTKTSHSIYRVLLSAWELIRKACLLFFWRGRGFHSDLRMPLTIDRANLAPRFTQEILFGTQSLLRLATSDNNTIGNALLWPLVVAACECCHDVDMQANVLELLDAMDDQFDMSHLGHVKRLVSTLWRNVAENDIATGLYSLEALARYLGLVIPLF